MSGLNLVNSPEQDCSLVDITRFLEPDAPRLFLVRAHAEGDSPVTCVVDAPSAEAAKEYVGLVLLPDLEGERIEGEHYHVNVCVSCIFPRT